jgi:hypothetical protein
LEGKTSTRPIVVGGESRPRLARKIRIVRFNHIAIVVWKIDAIVLGRLKDLGWAVHHRFQNPEQGRNGVALTHPDWAVALEVLEPSGEDSYLVPFLQNKKFGPWALHHLTFDVEDLENAREVLKAKGFGFQPGNPYEVLIHPKRGGGTLIQLFPDRGRSRGRKKAESN